MTTGKKKKKKKAISLSLLLNNAHSDTIPHRVDSPAPKAATASGGAEDKAVRSPVSSPETALVFPIVVFIVVGVRRRSTLRLRSSSRFLLSGRAATQERAGAGAKEALQMLGAPRVDDRTLDDRMVSVQRRKNKRGREKEVD